MKTWVPLYGMIWLIFGEFMSLLAAPRGSTLSIYLHIALGAGVIALAFLNVRNLEASRAPARTKRISRAILNLSVVGAALGVLLYFGVAPSLGFLRGGPVFMLHLFVAFAVLTQAASVATSYDMWEEMEFGDSAPGAAPGRLPAAQAEQTAK